MLPTVLLLSERPVRFMAEEPIRNAQLTAVAQSQLMDFLLAEAKPAGLVVDAATLTLQAAHLLGALYKRDLLLPGVVAVVPFNEEVVQRAWQAPHALSMATSAEAVMNAVARFRAAYIASPADYLISKLRITCPATLKMLRLLAADPSALTLSAEELALRCGVKRTMLFQRVAAAGLPQPEQLQMLFRLLPCVHDLLRGETVEEATWRGHFSDTKAFRRALLNRLGQTAKEVREFSEWTSVIDHWLTYMRQPRSIRKCQAGMQIA